MYNREQSRGAEISLEWDNGVSWLAHPDEGGKRASHALAASDGVWIVDPLDAPEIGEQIEQFGEIAGVTVTSAWHARDAGTFAHRYDTAVHIPEWMGRIDGLVDAPIERYGLAPGTGDLQTIPCRPFPGWQEVFLYHESDATLVVPDSLGTTSQQCLDNERLGMTVLRRLQPPVQLRGLEPDRILVGHGKPITTDATQALESVLDGARLTFPKAVYENGAESARSFAGALR